MTPKEAIEELHSEFVALCDSLDSDEGIPEFNRLFFEWLDKEFDLEVRQK